MKPEEMVEELIASGILQHSGNSSLRTSTSFRDALLNECEHVDALNEEQYAYYLERTVPDEHQALFSKLSEYNREIAAKFKVIEGRETGFSAIDIIQIIPVLASFEQRPPPDEGTPNGFFPVKGTHLPLLFSAQRGAVVYIWKIECEPCTEMKSILGGIPIENNDLQLLSIYGPDSARFLYEEYNVPGAPTTLFIVDGEVDARLYGARNPSVIETEIEKTRELAIRSSES